MEEIKNFEKCMNPPINPFEGHTMDYVQGAIDYCGLMSKDMWDTYDNITSVQLKKAFRGTNIMPSKRMEIMEIVQDLVRLTSGYYEDYVVDYGNAHMTKILNDMEQSGTPDQNIVSILNSFHITDPIEVGICLADIQSRGLTTRDEISQYVDEYFTEIENSV